MATNRELDYNKEFCATREYSPIITISYQMHLKLIRKLKAQLSIENIANGMKVNPEDLLQSLEFYRIDPKLWALSGLNELKVKMLKLVEQIPDTEKQFNAGMKYLDKYDTDGIITDSTHTLRII